LGRALSNLGRFEEAVRHLRRSLEIRQELGEFKETVDSLAALARAYLGLGDLEQAAGLVETILEQLTEQGWEGFDRPVEVFLICYLVLRAVQDGRAASLLQQGYNLLRDVASKIEDDELRRSYLERVPENRAMIQAWSEAGQAR
jgi:tetratricopeptide (TPR) repeat protein